MSFYEEIEFLGYVVSPDGIRPNESGILAVKRLPTPRSVRDVQGFISLCSYFRKFIRNFSLIASPLYALTKKSVEFKFELEQIESFELLK